MVPDAGVSSPTKRSRGGDCRRTRGSAPGDSLRLRRSAGCRTPWDRSSRRRSVRPGTADRTRTSVLVITAQVEGVGAGGPSVGAVGIGIEWGTPAGRRSLAEAAGSAAGVVWIHVACRRGRRHGERARRGSGLRSDPTEPIVDDRAVVLVGEHDDCLSPKVAARSATFGRRHNSVDRFRHSGIVQLVSNVYLIANAATPRRARAR